MYRIVIVISKESVFKTLQILTVLDKSDWMLGPHVGYVHMEPLWLLHEGSIS
jgi:hypothetical protein